MSWLVCGFGIPFLAGETLPFQPLEQERCNGDSPVGFLVHDVSLGSSLVQMKPRHLSVLAEYQRDRDDSIGSSLAHPNPAQDDSVGSSLVQRGPVPERGSLWNNAFGTFEQLPDQFGSISPSNKEDMAEVMAAADTHPGASSYTFEHSSSARVAVRATDAPLAGGLAISGAGAPQLPPLEPFSDHSVQLSDAQARSTRVLQSQSNQKEALGSASLVGVGGVFSGHGIGVGDTVIQTVILFAMMFVLTVMVAGAIIFITSFGTAEDEKEAVVESMVKQFEDNAEDAEYRMKNRHLAT